MMMLVGAKETLVLYKMFLTPNDFTIHDGELVKPNDQGYSFVFFFTNTCPLCNDVKPAFNRLSRIIRGVSFAYMDVEQNNWLLRDMSLRTRTPIDYVPLLILFANGRPIAQFFQDEDVPQNNTERMKKFIMATTGGHQQHNHSSQNAGADIPAYSIGIPGNLALRKVCKLYDNAYMKQ